MPDTTTNSEVIPAEIDAIVASIGTGPGDVIPILQAIQEKYNYLPQEALERVCESSTITPAAITGVASFYAQFRLRPAGKYTVKVCVGTACHVMGADAINDAFKDELKIPDDDDTDADRQFTVEKVACLGCCMLAPAAQVSETTYGHLTSQKTPGILADFISSQNAASAPEKRLKIWNGKASGEIRMCTCSSCLAAGAGDVRDEIKSYMKQFNIPAKLKNVGCTGIAYQTPLVTIAMRNGRTYQYGRVRPEDTQAMLLEHFKPSGLLQKGNASISRFVDKFIVSAEEEQITRYPLDIRYGPDAMFLGPQRHIATERSGTLNPLDIDEYIKHGGFETLKKCLETLKPEDVIEEVSKSGLRGRGGGGFPTGRKWGFVAAAHGDKKYIICNGDEGDPGAFMDRMLLESFPYRIIEGMLIAAYATGGADGIFYIRAEYPFATESIRKAIEICLERNFLGDAIMGTDFDCRFTVFSAAGAFVCGEETALIASIEGGRGMPKLRPPFPAQEGLWKQPTLVNNVESFATIPWIMRNGASKFAELGTEKSKGTKTFALAGKIERSGLIEVPMGLTLRQIVVDIGGGIKDGKKLKAIQVGGPSGGCIPESLADTPVDYEALAAVGAIMGSGGMVVLDEDDCMVDIARYFMEFTHDESCGKCTYCRVGTKRMLEILERLCIGKGRKGDLEKLEQLSVSVKAGSICGLGKTAPNPVLSILNHFRDEYQAHIEGRCPAGKCKELITYTINNDCIGCTRCAQGCAFDAIIAHPFRMHDIIQENCTKCDICFQVCPVDAVQVN